MTILRPAVLALVALSFVGCNPVPPPIEGRDDPYGRRQIMFDSARLERKTSVGRPHPARDDAGILFVTVPITNSDDDVLDVEYRATFFDSTGRVIDQPTTWFRKRLTPRVADQVMVNSTTPRAADFQIDFRRAR